jgi:hypothetical protein
MARKVNEPARFYIYRLTFKNPKYASDSYIYFTLNIFREKTKHKLATLDVTNQDFLYRRIREIGGWKLCTFDILEECVLINEIDMIEKVKIYISKFKPNLNGENMNKNEVSCDLPSSKVSNDKDKYVCVCKRSYAHRSSYYKHANTCLQYQHSKTTKTDDTSSVSEQTNDVVNEEYTPATKPIKSKKIAPIIVTDYAHDYCDNDDNSQEPTFPTFPTFPTSELKRKAAIHIRPAQAQAPPANHENELSNEDDDVKHTVSELLTEQNEKLKEYIRQMIAVLSTNKKRTSKSLANSLVFELLDQNKTLQKQIIELSKERNIVVNNTNNNQFNLNFFLNEQCKDAINMTDFVNSLEITLDDLTYTRNQGLVEGISKVMIDGLKQIDLYKRPIHCTDQKRDTIYIKDNHTWARDEGNIRMKQAFVDIANKEYFAIKMWMDMNPDWESNSSLQDFHHKMVKNVLHEIKDDPIGERKILKNIERETFIEK